MQIQQVVLNLLRNSIDALSEKKGHARILQVAIQTDATSSVRLSVEDTGRGISAADQERIFDAFFTTKPNGMGLGLAICRTIIERHAGKLDLLKSSPRGSIFEISLPLAAYPQVSEPRGAI